VPTEQDLMCTAKEDWLRTEGVARYDAYRRDPSSAQPAAEVFARLRAHHAKRTKGKLSPPFGRSSSPDRPN